MVTPEEIPPEVEALWREMLTHGHRTRMAILPGSPRCTVCRIPVGGFGGTMLRPLGRKASRKNPNLCNLCDEVLPQGEADVEIAVLFADVRGSTALGERMRASAFAALLNRFYRVAMDALLAHGAIIDNMIGDEVMALFIPAISGTEYRRAPVHAAEGLLRGVGYGSKGEPWLPLGIGVHAGSAYVGKVGTADVNDFTALGDTVNSAARLQGEAKAGEIVMSEGVYQEVAQRYPDLERRTVSLEGKEETFAVRILRAAHPSS